MVRVLFVCHGNICRSPMAEFVFDKLIGDRGLEDKYEADSRATSTEETGCGLYPAAARELRRRRVPTGAHSASQFTMKDYESFDLIVGMDNANMRNLNRMTGGDPERKLRRLMDYTERPGEVDDPWYTGEFSKAYLDILEGCEGLLQALEAGRG